MNGDVKRRLKEAGKDAGQLYQKPCMLVQNLYAMAVKGAAENSTSAGRLLCSALLFVSVVDFALTNIGSTPLPQSMLAYFLLYDYVHY